MAIYAIAAIIMDVTIILPDFLTGKSKCAVSKDVISNPTNAHGARIAMLNIALALLTPEVPNVQMDPPENAWGRQNTEMTAIPVTRISENTVYNLWSAAFADINIRPTPASTATDKRVSFRYIVFPATT